MQWYVTSHGTRHVEQRFEQIAQHAENPRPAFEEIYLTILDIEDELFASQGARGGHERWAPLTLAWKNEKVRTEMDYHILQAYGNLRRSLTTYRHPMQNIRIERTKIVFGTKYEKGKWLYHGWKQPITPFSVAGTRRTVTHSRVPGRPFVRFTHADAQAFGREIMRYLLRPGGPGTISAGIT